MMQEDEPRLFDRSYIDWTAEEVALYTLKHCPEQKEQSIEFIKKLFVDQNYDGKYLKKIAEEERRTGQASAEWRGVVISIQFPLELPQVEMKRGVVHPVVTTILDIPMKLMDSNSGIWRTLNAFCRRMEKYDAVYSEDEGYWCHDRAGRPYFNPGSWRRYGFYPRLEDENDEQVEEILKNWHVGYHGTKFLNVDSIVQFGLVPPGTKIEQNNRCIVNQNGRAGAVGEKIPIYVTPSISYAAHYLYTNPQKDGDEWVYCVFQVRVRPGSFRIQGNTLWSKGWGDKKVLFDERFGPDELEWLVENEQDIRVTGLMVHRDRKQPEQKITELFEKHKTLTSTKRAEGKGKWFWNSAQSTGKTLDRNGPWKEYDDGQNALIEKAYLNWQAVTYLGKVDTDKGVNPYFIDYTKMEQIRCNDNKLRRYIKREVH